MSDEAVFSTPMMQQYLKLKQEFADCLLWFRLGDFYEMFLEQAEIGSRVLGITLTSRSRGKDGRVPMAGIPYHAADNYLAKLIEAGYKVAICEQVSEPNGKTLVERKVIRIVSPGTTVDTKYLHEAENNFVLSLAIDKGVISLGLADISTGEFKCASWPVTEMSQALSSLQELLTHYPVAEVVLPPTTRDLTEVTEVFKKHHLFTSQPTQWKEWQKKSTGLAKNISKSKNLKSVDVTAALMLIQYLEFTQQTRLKHLKTLQPLNEGNYLKMDRSTLYNLEVFQTLHGGKKVGSLIHILDRTKTALGARLLKKWLHQPLCQAEAIQARLEHVELLVTHTKLRQELQLHLNKTQDIERLLAKLSVGVGTPRDVIAIAQTLQEASMIFQASQQASLMNISEDFLARCAAVADLIQSQLTEHPPITASAGGVIRSGINKRLDELRNITGNSREVLSKLEQQERAATGISSLKVKYNQVFGFYIEVSKANLASVPETYQRKQTLVNAERFITPELKIQEDIILHAEAEIAELETKLFNEIVFQVLAEASALQHLASAIAYVDCVASLAEVAVEHQYCKPVISSGTALKLTESRHPVVEQLVAYHQFIANDVFIDTTAPQILIITGPNMAGKSVLMRQVALITLMAHIGSFVPATSAEISVTDHIFVRSGASDIITSGLSTFMVEMVETAHILHHATERSLIVMDEIGRGTSTYDGISIAWAVAEYLLQLKAKTLFATHYHELQALADEYPQHIQNFHMHVETYQGKPLFLYALTAGGASHSHGVSVAELAGLPPSVIQKAKEMLKSLESRTSHA